MKYTILEVKNSDIKVEFEFDNNEKSIQTISVAPYWINTSHNDGVSYAIQVNPTDNLHLFLSNYIVAYNKGKQIINISIDNELIGQTIQIN